MPKAANLVFALLLSSVCYSQSRFSVASDVSFQHNLKRDQRFWAFGPTVQVIFHTSAKNAVYIWYAFYTNGKFTNRLTATAKSSSTIPQQINYIDSAKMRLKEISMGWKKYLKGSPDMEKGWALYSNAGFGLVLGRMINTLSVNADTSLYNVPVLGGQANFKRLTIDLGLGFEIPMSGDLYFYGETRAWIPTTDYPSKYIFVNDNAPLVMMFCAGIRVLF